MTGGKTKNNEPNPAGGSAAGDSAPARLLKVRLTIHGQTTWWRPETTEMTLCSPLGNTVHELKGQVAEETRVAVQDQTWTFAGKVMHDKEEMSLDGPIRPWSYVPRKEEW